MRATVLSILVLAMIATPASADDAECASPSACRPPCQAGNQSACEWLGEYYTGVDLIEEPRYSAIGVKLLEGACAKANQSACAALARALRVTQLGHVDEKRIGDLLAAACKAGEGDACTDPKQRVAGLEKACTTGNAEACVIAGGMYQPPDPAEYGPDSDDEERPPPVPDIKPDAKKAKALKTRGHKLAEDACKRKRARTCGAGAETNPELERACTVGASEACMERGRLAIAESDAKWVTWQTRACELGDFLGCATLSAAYTLGHNGVKKDAAKGLELMQKGCDAQDGGACAAAAKQTKDPARAGELKKRACELGETAACAK
jgi:TPR repeat protein